MNIFAPLAEGRIPRRYSAGQVIYLQGTTAHEFYYLIQGTARSYISSPSGGERILTIHHTGDLMGEASFFDECPRVSSAIAVTECEIVSINREHLDHVFQVHSDLYCIIASQAPYGILSCVSKYRVTPHNTLIK